MDVTSFLFPWRRIDPRQPERNFIVHTTDTGVVCERPDGKTEQLAWADLQAIIIETAGYDPAYPDIFWILAGRSFSSGCVVPQGATGDEEMIDRLMKLPGFDHEAMGRAMGCKGNNKFLCWQRAKTGATLA
ncbi:MAG TPA: hypothetical protein VG733_13145 [Chthoniobacteraceae bacterium]|nr:hypothetical protein [Chthoniobacteraceae bacterium]